MAPVSTSSGPRRCNRSSSSARPASAPTCSSSTAPRRRGRRGRARSERRIVRSRRAGRVSRRDYRLAGGRAGIDRRAGARRRARPGGRSRARSRGPHVHADRLRPGARGAPGVRARDRAGGEPRGDHLLLDHRRAAVAAAGRDLARLDRRREPSWAPRHLAARRRAAPDRGGAAGADDGRQLARATAACARPDRSCPGAD